MLRVTNFELLHCYIVTLLLYQISLFFVNLCVFFVFFVLKLNTENLVPNPMNRITKKSIQ